MKYIIYFFLLILLALFTNISELKAQCDPTLYNEEFIADMNELEKKPNYLKNFSVNITEGNSNARYSLNLHDKTWYRFYFYESDKFDAKGHYEIFSDSTLLGHSYISSVGENHYFDYKSNKPQELQLVIHKDEGSEYCLEVVLCYLGKAKKGVEDVTVNIKKKEDVVYTLVDEMPVFDIDNPGISAFRDWVVKNMTYPEEAKKEKIEGKVYVQFVITEFGVVEQVNVVKGVDPILDTYAEKLIRSSPQWAKPAKLKGLPVKVKYTIPVGFKL